MLNLTRRARCLMWWCEPADSNELSPADADLILDNNAGLGFLTAQIARLVSALDARV